MGERKQATLQKVQFQRFDKAKDEALFLFIIREEESDEEKQEIRGYEVSYYDLSSVVKLLYQKYELDILKNLPESSRCIEDSQLIFQILDAIINQEAIYYSDIFQGFLTTNYKYSLNYQSKNSLSSCFDSQNEEDLNQQQNVEGSEHEISYNLNEINEDEKRNESKQFNNGRIDSNTKSSSAKIEDEADEEEEKTIVDENSCHSNSSGSGESFNIYNNKADNINGRPSQFQGIQLLPAICPQIQKNYFPSSLNPAHHSASVPIQNTQMQLQIVHKSSQPILTKQIPNYSQFNPQRCSIIMQQLNTAIQQQQQSQKNYQQANERRKSSVMKNKRKFSGNMEDLSFSSHNPTPSFENRISFSRSKHVIKLQKDQIEVTCHEQLKQAQNLGSVSSTNSFDDSPLARQAHLRREKKLTIINPQMQSVDTFQDYNQLVFQSHPPLVHIASNNQASSINSHHPSFLLEFNAAMKQQHRLSLPIPINSQGNNQGSNFLLTRQKYGNTPSDVSLCGNTVDGFEGSINVMLSEQQMQQISQTQNTITQNNITEEYDDSSVSSNSSDKSHQKNINSRHKNALKEYDAKEKKGKFKNWTNPSITTSSKKSQKKAIHSEGDLQSFVIVQPFKQLSKEEATAEKTEIMFSTDNFNKKADPKIYNRLRVVSTQSMESQQDNQSNSNVKLVEEEYSSQYDFNSNAEQVNVEDVQVGLLAGDIRKPENKEKICNLLLNKQYSDLSEIGSGSFGLVLRARTPEGYIRALKIHSATNEKTEIEFKLAKFLSSEGTENLSANNIMTYNTIKFRDTISNKKIEVIEMELADDSLKNEIYCKTPNISEIGDDKFRQICNQLVINVLSMHNMCVVHRDLKLDNILVSNGNYFLADFGISEEIGPQLIKQFVPGTDCFSIRQNIAGTQLYFSPIIRDAHCAHPKQYSIDHDPFKSDIYTVGLILLEIELVRKRFSPKQIRAILSDKYKAYEQACNTNINQFLLKDDFYILKNKLYKPMNILAEMLRIEEKVRISSVKLCLVCQLDKIILSSIIVPHHKIFPPIIEIKTDNTCVIRYTIKLLTYEGEYMKTDEGRILRHGSGQLYKLVEEESVIYKVLVYEGKWDNDLPHGKGQFYFFQNEWVYEGEFKNGQFFGDGVVKFIDWVVYKGKWYNFILEDFLVPVNNKEDELEAEGKIVEIQINTHDKDGYLRNIGTDEIELQFETNTFRQYALDVLQFKRYLQDKKQVRIVLETQKSVNDFDYSGRQQLLLLAINKHKMRKFEVFIKYFKHEPLLDEVLLEQLASLLNSSTEEQKNAFLKDQKQWSLLKSDSDIVVYLNCEFFSKECTFTFLGGNQESFNGENFRQIKFLKNIGIPQQIEEESLIKLLLSPKGNYLKELDLSRANQISSSVFIALDNRNNKDIHLNMLNLRYEALSESTIQNLFKFQFINHIQVLDFSYSQFDDKCVLALLTCTHFTFLQVLLLQFCSNLTHKALELMSQKLTITAFPSLTHLDLEGILIASKDNSHERDVLLQFDQKHHLSSNISNLTLLDQPEQFFNYLEPNNISILKQIQFITKETILRKNLLGYLEFEQQFVRTSSSSNPPSLVQLNLDDQEMNRSLIPTSLSRMSSANLLTSQTTPSLDLTPSKSMKAPQNQSKQQINSLSKWIEQMTDKNIPAFQKFLKQPKISQITTFSLKSTNVDDSVIKILSNNPAFSNLKEIDLSECQKLTSMSLSSLLTSKIFKNPLKIDISNTKVTSLLPKKEQINKVSSLNITSCHLLNPSNIVLFLISILNAQSIKTLLIDSCKFGDQQVCAAVSGCNQLLELHILISSDDQELKMNGLALNIILEKGTQINFYSNEVQIEVVFELVQQEVFSAVMKRSLSKQVFVNGISFDRLNRFSSGQEATRISKTQILDIPSKEVPLALLDDDNIAENLRKLLNSRNFLLVQELNVSRLKVNSYAGQLLAGSRYTRSLVLVDLSYSTINDEDLFKLSKSKYLPKLQVMKLNNCKDISEKGINHLLNSQATLENLKTIELKHRLLNLYLIFPQSSERVQIIADSILFKADQQQYSSTNSSSQLIQQRQLSNQRFQQFSKYWAKIFRDNMQIISAIEISGFDENIIDHFLSLITDKNRIKKFIIDFSKKNHKTQSFSSNNEQFQSINEIFGKLPDLAELRLDFSKWKDMTDRSVKVLTEGIVGLKMLKILELNLSEWGKDNPQITDLSSSHFRNAFQKISQINYISIDLSNWGENNLKISDKSISCLTEGLYNIKDYLTYLSLNLSCWGPQMTNNSLYQLNFLLKDLKLLSFLHLGLQEWGKDNSNINDSGIESLTNAIGNSRFLNQLDINLAQAAHLNCGIGDASVQNLAKSLTQINSLSSLKINLAWWMVDINLYGFNTDVSDLSIKDLSKAIGKLSSLTELDLNFDRWGYKNNFIKDESIINLADNIENLHALNSLSLNFDWWGLGNEKITETSLVCLADRLGALNKLTFLQLVLSLDRWKKIEEKHIAQFKEKMTGLKSFNKNITIDIR